MPEKTTARLGLPYPTSNGKINAGPVDYEELAKKVDEVVASLSETQAIRKKILAGTAHAASYTAVAGEMGIQSSAGATTTLPLAPEKDDVVALVCVASSCKLFGNGVFIYGGFTTIASKTGTVTLTEGQHVIVKFDGTNWAIIAGEVKGEQGYEASVARTTTTEYEPSATRPTFVVLATELEASKLVEIYVGTQLVGKIESSAVAGSGSLGFMVPAGKKWRFVGIVKSASSTYLTL